MDQFKARDLLSFQIQMQREGWRLFAWNGLGFDLRWIGHNAGDMETRAGLSAWMKGGGMKRRKFTEWLPEDLFKGAG